MKKIISVLLSAVFLLTSLSIFASAEVIENDAVLQFNSDGKFKILHICDIQDTPYVKPQILEYIEKTCDAENPDLIVLGGDNLGGNCGKAATDTIAKWQVKRAINSFMSIFEEYKIPTAVTFGNHDGEKQISDEVQMEIYRSYDCCVAIDEGEDIYGCGTYNIPIMSSNGNSIAYNIWCFDSNAYLDDGYDYVHDDQVDWYIKKSDELKSANGGSPVPSLAFQHIVVPEIYEAMEYGTYIEGMVNENPSPSKHPSKQFNAMVNQGDVKAMFFGHDHVNTYTYAYKGINLTNTPAGGFGVYGDSNRGIRVIELDEKDTSTYKTRLINYLESYVTTETELCRWKMNASDSIYNDTTKALNGIRYIYKSLEEGKSIFSLLYEVLCTFM